MIIIYIALAAAVLLLLLGAGRELLWLAGRYGWVWLALAAVVAAAVATRSS